SSQRAEQRMHRLRRQQHRELHHELPLRTHRSQVELPATHHHVVEKGIERELIFARPPRNYLSYPRTMPADEQGSRRGAASAWVGGGIPQQAPIGRFRWLECIE